MTFLVVLGRSVPRRVLNLSRWRDVPSRDVFIPQLLMTSSTRTHRQRCRVTHTRLFRNVSLSAGASQSVGRDPARGRLIKFVGHRNVGTIKLLDTQL